MAPLSLRIVQDNGVVTRKVKLDPNITVREAHAIVRDKSNMKDDTEYGLFLKSVENDISGIWMEEHRPLSYYMLRDGDRVDYITRIRNLKIKMLDDSVKTMQLDQSKIVSDLMMGICGRLGITNHEEYGLCLDPDEEGEEGKEKMKTLTRNKKSHLKERDREFEQLSKRLKTDDNVEWIDTHKTLSEACVGPQRTVTLKRRLYYSDRNVDSRDPVQLGLLYVQARDNILGARHPVTEDQAVAFAGIQCQIHFGDFQEEKHKPGFIENMKEYMPEQYASSWGIEKKIFKEYRKHQGLSELEAKHLYTKTARALPTYGVTFFLVKEKQKDKKKLVPRLLGINSESILRLDETTKEVLQTWPLTHVKTYHAAKGEIFTLDFGDYSAKEYSVKTRDAYRIRDILEDYIDIIRKRMLAQYNTHHAESASIMQDNIQSSTANMVQHISNNSMKMVEHCIVGPSKIVPYEAGKEACQGTQIMTVQQIVVSDKASHQQHGMKGEVPMRGDMSMPFTRRLNRLNSNSVKIVQLLTDPTQQHIDDSRKIVEAMNADMPAIREGVKETMEKQTNDDERKKLQEQMNQLDQLIRTLSDTTAPGTQNASEAADAAMQTADLTTAMYFALDARTKRRSLLLSRSRASFISDDESRRSVRKASFVAAASTALNALTDAQTQLRQTYSGPVPDARHSAALEGACVDKLGKLNAAIAHYMMAHSDPNNVDYEAAVNSMNTIHELMPEFAKDAQALASTKEPATQRQILQDARTLCDAAQGICSSTEDRQKMEEAAKAYTEASGRLVFTFGKGKNSGKENELLDLADEVAAQTSLLLLSAQELIQQTPSEPAAAEVDAAGVRTADAAKNLISRVQLTAPTIHEPHCQSAVTAAAEALSSSVQQLATSWKPLVEPPERHEFGEKLHQRVMELAKALDRLKSAYSGMGADDLGDVFEAVTPNQEQQRLKFISTMAANPQRWNQLEQQLTQPTTTTVNNIESAEAQRRLGQRLGQLNAAIASLLAAMSDREHPDYGTAEQAMNTINELMPLVVQDSKVASANQDSAAQAAMTERIRALCEASKSICDGSEGTSPQDRSEAIAKFTDASGKLVFGMSHRGNPNNENQILKLADSACQKTSQLLSGVQQLSGAAAAGGAGAAAAEMEARGAACNDAAQHLLTTAQLTAPSITEPPCQAALLSSIHKLSARGQDLAASWRPLQQEPAVYTQVQGLETQHGQLQEKLDALRSACQSARTNLDRPDIGWSIESDKLDMKELAVDPREQQKLQFIKTMTGAKEQLQLAQNALDKPIPLPLSSDEAAAVEHRLSGRLGELNAAIAALLAATADREKPDYESAEKAMTSITKLLPQVVQDTQSSMANKDAASRAAMMDLIRELCEASRAVAAGADDNNSTSLNDAVSKFSDASGKLVYVVNPRSNANLENQIMGLAAAACNKASQLLPGVQQLSEAVGGERGQELDSRGAAVADAAQGLLASAKVTAPTISNPHCKEALLSSVDLVSSSAAALSDSWQPLLEQPQHRQQAVALQTPTEQLETQLEKLRSALQTAGTKLDRPDIGWSVEPDRLDMQVLAELPREQQKLQLIKTMTGAKEQLQLAQNALDKPIPAPLSSDKAAAVEHRLSGRLGELNAAIAALLAATADRERPDYVAADEAIKTISELMPHVVQDSQSSMANKDAASRAAMMDLLRELCEASRTVTAQSDTNDPQGLSEAVAKFCDASGKLVYVVSPRVNADREKQIHGLSADACTAASQLLLGVQQLAETVDGAEGQELDAGGVTLASAAQGLLATSQLTAASISEPHCKEALLSSVEVVSSSAAALSDTWKPLLQQPQHRQQAAALQAPLEHLEKHLDKLRKACDIADVKPCEQQRLRFLKSVSAAEEQMQKAQAALNKPIPPPLSGDKAAAVQHRLSGRLGELNAAIAALLGATSNRERPDYVAADEAIKAISELMPHVVKDSQSSMANMDAGSRAAMMDLIRELCEASRAVATQSGHNNLQGLNDAVSKFSDASGKLVYMVSPRVNEDREKQIMELTAGACSNTSQLLSGVQQLVEAVGGETAQELDSRGAVTADASQGLIATARLTAASISEPHCKERLLSSVETLFSSAAALSDTWKPLLQQPQQRQQAAELQVPLEQLQVLLEKLKKACDIPDAERPEQQKLQFVNSMSKTKDQIQKAQDSLDKPLPAPLSSDEAAAVEHRLSGRLGELNASIAALLAATANLDNPDYKKAEQATKTITELLPHVVQDAQSSCANKDPATRAAMLDSIRELCKASTGICAGADGTNPQGLNDAVQKFSSATGRLAAAAGPDQKAKLREQQLLELATHVNNSASNLLPSVRDLAATAGPRGQELAARGAALSVAAQGLLASAQVVASSFSDPHCKASLLPSLEQVSASAHSLDEAAGALAIDPGLSQQVCSLRPRLQQLLEQLEALRRVCKADDAVADIQLAKEVHGIQKLEFKQTKALADLEMKKAQTALDKPLPAPLSSDKVAAVEHRLSGRLGELNAAIAALLAATANRERPDYKTANQAVKTTSEVLPQVVQDSRSSMSSKDAASRAAMLDILRELCEASRAVAATADDNNSQGLTEAVSKFSDASGKLVYAVNPRVNPACEQKIMQLTAEACNKASQLLPGVQQLSEAVGGERGQELDSRGAAVADAAQGLLGTAQVTASSISSPPCKTALLASVDQISGSCQELESSWRPLEHSHRDAVKSLQPSLQALQVQLEALRRAVNEPDQLAPPKKTPPPPTRATPLSPSTKTQLPLSRPPPPPRGDSKRRTSDATKEFLDRVRCEESLGQQSSVASKPASAAAGVVMTDDEKRQHQLFIQSVDDADKILKKAEQELMQAVNSQSSAPAVSAGECLAKQARLQRNIALASVQVASLVGANYAESIDYSSATKSTDALPKLINSIVEDGSQLSSTVNDKARKEFLEDMLQMCQASRSICDAAKSDRQKLNDAAVEFGDKSTKLLYIVSNDVDPTLEQEIITRAKAIGDSIVQISSRAGSVVEGAGAPDAKGAGAPTPAVEALCAAGARAQDGAGKLLYTAKLVAPSIYETPCQEALFKSADSLSTELRTFADSWKPFSSAHGNTVRELSKEADNLERILDGLKSDVKGGRIGQRREIERLVVEDTPMRQLTVMIMDDAKKLSECGDLTPVLRQEYTNYSKKLSDALRALDLANARCKRTPHDTNKRRELENSIQNLQVILLQERPSREDKERSNIVDLKDFIDEVSAEADKLADATNGLQVPTANDKKIIQGLCENGQKISKAAYKLTHTDDVTGFETSYNDILDVDQFGQECDEVIRDINAQLKSMEDAKARNLMYSRILPLTESCNVLRFATKSGISAEKSATLDSTLDDLDDVESRVIKSIVKDTVDNSGVTVRFASAPKVCDATASTKLCSAVCAAQGALPRAPLTAYIASCAAGTDTTQPGTRDRLLRHLFKLVHLLKTQTVTTSKRIATWQPIDDPEVATITEQILQEIQNPESKFQPESAKVKKVVNDSDLTQLLVPGPERVFGDKRQQEDKLAQLCTKLNSMCNALTLSIAAPESLTRSAHASSEAAVELAAVARGCKNKKDPVQCERIEEAVNEMTFTTYGLLKTAEMACQDPNNPNSKRRLMDACKSLNTSIDKLVSASSCASALSQGCGSVSRALAQAQASVGQTPAPTSALPYDQCCAALNDHQEIVYKLKNDQPMTRSEFARSLHEMNEAVVKTTEISTQCAYLISVSEKDSDIAKKGPVDVPRIQRSISALQDSCMQIIGASNVNQAKEDTEDLHKRVEDFSRALDDAQMKVKDGGAKATLTRAKGGVTSSAASLCDALKEGGDMDKVTCTAVNLLEEVNRAHTMIERCPLVPSAKDMSVAAKAKCDEIANNSKTLLNNTMALVKEVGAHEESETMTWVTFNNNKSKLLEAYDALVKCIRVNGQRAGILEGSPEDEADESEAQSKTYLEVQVDLANKWLNRPMCKAEVKVTGQDAARKVIDIAIQMAEELKGSEREEIRNVILETEDLLIQCSSRYDSEKYSVLMDRIKELKKIIQRGVVTRVVEDFMHEDPLEDLDLVVEAEQDEQKRKFLLERKIAELLAQLGRVTRTARFVADACGSQRAGADLAKCTEQTELLAPQLVQAAHQRIASPNNQAVIDNYKSLLAKYAESISKVRTLCDRAVDPMDFVQTAGDTMQRMREESSEHNDVLKGQRTSEAIIKLANRSIEVSMSSIAVKRDPELIVALRAAQKRILAATPAAGCRPSRLPDWKESTAEVLRTTGEVESALGGENIFKKQPPANGANQQIYTVARDLHECVREWSSRDNEIVAVARRVAVLMARLSEYMETDKKQALISTSKSIVAESREVAELAKKLAHECTDVRIKTNLLQTCERIPTISAQLKMLTTVKGSSLGRQGSEEDKEAMDMLVGNAQSLMISIQEVVKAAAGASVKIMSQRGPKLRWVRKNYY